MLTSLVGCGGNHQEEDNEFKPALDTQTECEIKVVGDYSNFEPLINRAKEFKSKYYPNVTLSYKKVDKYDDILPSVLEGDEKPNIFFSSPKMIGNEKYASITSHMEDLSDPALKLNLDSVRQTLVKRDANNKVMLVPIFSRTYGVLVNESLFKEKELNIPNNWTELLSVCASFVEKGVTNPIMGYTKDNKSSTGLMHVIAYPMFVAELAKNPEALTLANNLDARAGEYTRSALNAINKLVTDGYINIEECDKIGDNYEKTLLRFFEGDVPMMACYGDTVSGAKKRESKSEPFTKNPFSYSYYPLPTTEQGGYFIDSPSVQFSVNKNCENLAMTNEFMRFLLRANELDTMAAEKGLISSTKQLHFEPIYAPFGNVPAERTISPEGIGVQDQLVTQIRLASYQVGKGQMSVDEAVQNYGQFE